MPDPKKHHFVPEFLLKKFIIPNSKPASIWIHNLKFLGKRMGAPASAGYREHLYSLTTEGKMDVYWENQFQKLETEATPIIDKILALRGGHTLTVDEKTKFARFVGYSHARTPQFLTQIEKLMIRLEDAAENALRGKTDKLEQIALSSRENPKAYIAQFLEDPTQFIIPEPDKKRFLMGYMNDFGQKIAIMIRNDFSWFFPEAQEVTYGIADDPVIFYSREDGAGWRHGIGNPDIEIYFPLSPHICFVAFRDWSKSPDFSVEKVNELSIWQAQDRVFSSAQDIEFTNELERRSEIENIVSRDDLLDLYTKKSGGFTSGDVLRLLASKE